jgi:hypothetical protein
VAIYILTLPQRLLSLPSTNRTGPEGSAKWLKQIGGSTRSLDLSEDDNMIVATIMKQQCMSRIEAIRIFMQQKQVM